MHPVLIVALVLAFVGIVLAWWYIRSPGLKSRWVIMLSQICLTIALTGLFSWFIVSGKVQGMLFVLCAALAAVFVVLFFFWSYQLAKFGMNARKQKG